MNWPGTHRQLAAELDFEDVLCGARAGDLEGEKAAHPARSLWASGVSSVLGPLPFSICTHALGQLMGLSTTHTLTDDSTPTFPMPPPPKSRLKDLTAHLTPPLGCPQTSQTQHAQT